MTEIERMLAEANNIDLTEERTTEERVAILEDAFAELATAVLNAESDKQNDT